MQVGSSSVAVWEYGDPAGRAVFVFHGVPACGAGFAWADEPAADRGLRLIAPDRPGVGRSTPRDGWRVGDYPAMVDALADAMGVDRYAAWGYSGGGPYAAAVAALATGRVSAAAISAGMGEIGDGWASFDDFEKTDAQFLRMSRRRPTLARVFLRVAALGARMSPKAAMKSFAGQMSTSDRAVLDQLGAPKDAMRLFTEAFVSGSRGVVADYAALAQPWGVDLGATRIPVSVWQGTADTMVPPRHADGYVSRIPGATLVTWNGEGHLGTVTHAPDILDWLSEHAPR